MKTCATCRLYDSRHACSSMWAPECLEWRPKPWCYGEPLPEGTVILRGNPYPPGWPWPDIHAEHGHQTNPRCMAVGWFPACPVVGFRIPPEYA
jgi:hypothetical protein